jgi:hypothetical protein
MAGDRMNLFQEVVILYHMQEIYYIGKLSVMLLLMKVGICLARIIHERVRFGSVYGIPSGGTKLALALEKYITPGHPLRLVVDDVYTTGKSMKEVMTGDDLGFVVFARRRIDFHPQHYIRSIFTMDMI